MSVGETMSAGERFATIVLLALPLTCLADKQGEQSKLSCVKDFAFSHDFLARHPNVGAACREVAIRDGTKWVRFEAEVTEVVEQEHLITANFLDSDDNIVATVTFKVSPSARLEVNGSRRGYDQLKSGDRLTVWMPEN